MRTRKIRDYTRDRGAARSLQNRIERYWREKGHTDVKTYLDITKDIQGNKNYHVRSNLHFKVPVV